MRTSCKFVQCYRGADADLLRTEEELKRRRMRIERFLSTNAIAAYFESGAYCDERMQVLPVARAIPAYHYKKAHALVLSVLDLPLLDYELAFFGLHQQEVAVHVGVLL